MPILASIVRSLTTRRLAVSDENRSLDFRSIDGKTAVRWDGVNVRILAGALGLDVPPRDVVRERIPGLPGSRVRQVSDLERPIFLPMLVASTAEDWRGLNDRLAQIRQLTDYRSDPAGFLDAEGTFDLIATADGQERRLRCNYLAGMEGNYAEDLALPEWRRFGLDLVAVDPYWHGQEWSTPSVGLPSVVPFLSNDIADAFPRQLAPSVAIGADMPLNIPGDLPSSPVIELIGPATSTTITAPSGLSVTIGALATDAVFVLDTGRTRRATLNGVDAWDLIGQSPRWPALQPGETTLSIVMAGATSASRARVYGDAMWETAW